MSEVIHAAFSDMVKSLRKQRKLTQQELATRLGVHRNTIGVWERGDYLPKSKTIVLELARILKLDTHETQHLLEKLFRLEHSDRLMNMTADERIASLEEQLKQALEEVHVLQEQLVAAQKRMEEFAQQKTRAPAFVKVSVKKPCALNHTTTNTSHRLPGVRTSLSK
ncbi:MAG TPA: helix-turn-helix domain-containing protein [Ktedonobacteraceae bacterium]